MNKKNFERATQFFLYRGAFFAERPVMGSEKYGHPINEPINTL